MSLYELGVGEPARRQGIGRSLAEALAALTRFAGTPRSGAASEAAERKAS